MVVHKLGELSVNFLDVRSLFQPSTSIPECPEPPLVFSAALQIGLLQKDFFSCRSYLGCFCFYSFRVVSVRGSIPFCMFLLV